MWANTANIATIAKLSLVAKSTKQRDMNFPAQTVANPEVFDMQASWTVTAVQVKNDLSGAWEDASSQFTVTNVNHDNAGGVSTAYKRYTFNMGTDTGARSIRVKWS
jgi:thioredoxin-like negative regulator of GroEL